MLKNKKFLIIGLIFLALVVATAVYFSVSTVNKASETISYSGDINDIRSADEALAQTELQILSTDISIGSASAPIKIISYDSFSCIHCANFFNTIFPEIKRRYIDTGKVLFVHRDFPLDVQALTATKLVKCFARNNNSAQVFNSIIAIYTSQKDWTNAENYQDKLSEIFEFAGANKSTLEDCIKDEELENRILEERLRASKNLKVNATPTFFINGRRYEKGGNLKSFTDEIDEILEQ